MNVDTGEAQGQHEEKVAPTTSKGKVARKGKSCLQSMRGIECSQFLIVVNVAHIVCLIGEQIAQDGRWSVQLGDDWCS